MSLARGEPFRPVRADWVQAALVAFGLFALYAGTAPRTVALEDDGLFILSSYFLGVEHPPGYPLFTLLGKIATLAPIGSVAYRVHLLSALFGGLTGAAVWLCARALMQPRLCAYVAALGFGLSPVFWSQAIIAEVYTFNTFFFFTLAYLGLTGAPLPAIALLFGLSLSNHWPLMLLAAPAFAVLLWPRRNEVLRRLPLLAGCLAAGLLPYVWMVVLSWVPRVVSFHGPLESLGEVWHFVSRASYADVDSSPTATWLDRLQFFGFLGGELLRQFALAGTALAAVGCAVQRDAWGSRVALFLGIAFAAPTALLLMLLNFDYDSVHKHLFHVYPLPAYGVAALWMALGAGWAIGRLQLGKAAAGCAVVVLLAAIAAVGSRSNLLGDYDWAERYAKAVLRTLPADAAVFARGDPDLSPIAYFHMVEGWRPDITLYQTQGLILGNRFFHPLRTSSAVAQATIREFIDHHPNPVVYTLTPPRGYGQRDRWLHVELARGSDDPHKVTLELGEEAMRFAEESLLGYVDRNAYAAYIQGQLRRSYGRVLAGLLVERGKADARMERHLELLEQDFYGALGVVEGLLASGRYDLRQATRYLERARDRMPPDASKFYRARFFEVRAYLRLEAGDRLAARRDLETALAVWPVSENGAVSALEDLYRRAGDEGALRTMHASLKR